MNHLIEAIKTRASYEAKTEESYYLVLTHPEKGIEFASIKTFGNQAEEGYLKDYAPLMVFDPEGKEMKFGESFMDILEEVSR